MSVPDVINGGYEMMGGLLLFYNCWRMYVDKEVKGFSLWVSFFFCSWGYWNLYYYPSLNQWWSFSGAIILVISNTIWLTLGVYYVHREWFKKIKWPSAFDVCLWILLFLSVLTFCHYYFMLEVH